eukprot:SAG31_NODE_13613_length_857_cov_1.287599_1_plen_99_part_00
MQVQVVVAVGMKGERLPKVTERQILEVPGGKSYVQLHESCLTHGMHERPTMLAVTKTLQSIEKEIRSANDESQSNRSQSKVERGGGTSANGGGRGRRQ